MTSFGRKAAELVKEVALADESVLPPYNVRRSGRCRPRRCPLFLSHLTAFPPHFPLRFRTAPSAPMRKHWSLAWHLFLCGYSGIWCGRL
jgi:hypothetical protein